MCAESATDLAAYAPEFTDLGKLAVAQANLAADSREETVTRSVIEMLTLSAYSEANFAVSTVNWSEWTIRTDAVSIARNLARQIFSLNPLLVLTNTGRTRNAALQAKAI